MLYGLRECASCTKDGGIRGADLEAGQVSKQVAELGQEELIYASAVARLRLSVAALVRHSIKRIFLTSDIGVITSFPAV